MGPALGPHPRAASNSSRNWAVAFIAASPRSHPDSCQSRAADHLDRDHLGSERRPADSRHLPGHVRPGDLAGHAGSDARQAVFDVLAEQRPEPAHHLGREGHLRLPRGRLGGDANRRPATRTVLRRCVPLQPIHAPFPSRTTGSAEAVSRNVTRKQSRGRLAPSDGGQWAFRGAERRRPFANCIEFVVLLAVHNVLHSG